MSVVSYAPSRTTSWNQAAVRSRSLPWLRAKVIVVACATLVAAAVRMNALDTYGFSEDEINKVHAIDEYRTGRFGANAEHPMLMKLAMWGSVEFAQAWNRSTPGNPIPLETAIRMPNAVAGAATTAVIFGVADLLFGTAAAAAAAVMWALDVNAIAINRIGKEDTFLLLFFLVAVFCYERAKREGAIDLSVAQRWYTLSGAAFGLMLASKYMPQYLGIYALFNLLTDKDPGANRPNRLLHFGAMAAAFLLADLTILLPSTWHYVAGYVSGRMLVHHGYPYAGGLYVTDVPVSPLGVPPTFYLRLLATKVPLVVLAAVVPGVIEMVRRKHDRGFVLLRVLAIFIIVPYSLMAAKFLRYSLPMLATVDLVAAVGLVSGIGWLRRKRWLAVSVRAVVATSALVVFGTDIVMAQQTAAPYYSLFQNAIGARVNVDPPAFPEETYDFGVREAVQRITALAAPSSVIVSDAPGVVGHYLAQNRRCDIAARSLSGAGLPPRGSEAWVVVQDEHATFENAGMVSQIRAHQRLWREMRIDDRVAAQVFRIGER